MGGGLFRAFPAGGGLSQTAVNDGAGARTQLAELATAGVVALVLIALAPLIRYIPEAALGGIVLVAAAGLLSRDEARAVRRLRVQDWVFALVTLAAVLVLGTLQGILVGVVVSLLTLFWDLNHPSIVVLSETAGHRCVPQRSRSPGRRTDTGLVDPADRVSVVLRERAAGHRPARAPCARRRSAAPGLAARLFGYLGRGHDGGLGARRANRPPRDLRSRGVAGGPHGAGARTGPSVASDGTASWSEVMCIRRSRLRWTPSSRGCEAPDLTPKEA